MIKMGDAKYTVDRIKELCYKTPVIRTDLFSQTFRINYGSDSEPDMKDIQIISIPLQESLEEHIFSSAGITEKQRDLFYQAFASALKDNMKKYRIVSESTQPDALKEHLLVFDTIHRERLSSSEMKFYYVSKPVDQLMESCFIQNASIQLSSVIKIWKSLLETIELLDNADLHLGTIDVEDIFVDHREKILIRLPIKSDFIHQNNIFKNLLPTHFHLSTLENGSFTKDTDIYVVNSLIYSIFNGELVPIPFDSSEKSGFWNERLSKLFSITDTKELISVLNKALHDLEEIPENDLLIPLTCDNEALEIKKKLSAIPLTASVNEHQKKSEKEPMDLPSEIFANDIPSNIKAKTQNGQEESLENGKEGVKKEKKSPFSKFASQISGKKKEQGQLERSGLLSDGTTSIPEDKPLMKVLSRKSGDEKKSKLDVLKNKKIIMTAIAGALAFAFVFTNLMPSTDPADGMKNASEDDKSTFVVANKNDSNESGHYSAIEKVDENPENNSTPFSSTYSEEDGDTVSDKDETEKDEVKTSNSSSSSAVSSAGSTNDSSSSGYRSSSSVSNSISSNSGSASSSYKPTTFSSSTSSSKKPITSTTNQPSQSTITDTEQQVQVVKPISTLSVSPNTLDLRIGESIAITPTMTCLFLSDNASVAVVDEGEVVAKGKGNCIITAKGLDGQTYNISVNVTE